MKRDEVFQDASFGAGGFNFGRQVADVFDDMVARSVPFYHEQQAMITGIGKRFHVSGTDVYDLGCSTGATLMNLCRAVDAPAKFIGYDNSAPMLQQAALNIAERGMNDRIELRLADFDDDPPTLRIENASVVTMGWTLQFVRPMRRDSLVASVYDGLRDGGAFVVTEKVLTNDAEMDGFFIDSYHDLKRRNGYSDAEITNKREALENVLIPYSVDENHDLFRRNGFQVVETFFQWFNFAGFLCLKRPAL